MNRTILVPVHQGLSGVSFSLVVSPPGWSACIKIIRIWGAISWWVTVTKRKFISYVGTSWWRICISKFRCCHWWIRLLYNRSCKTLRVKSSWFWSNGCVTNVVVGRICRWNIWWLNWSLIILVVFACLVHLMRIIHRWAIGSAISLFADNILARFFIIGRLKTDPLGIYPFTDKHKLIQLKVI